MEANLITWSILALSAAFFWSVVNIADKKLVTNQFPAFANYFVLESLAGLFVALVALFMGGFQSTAYNVLFLAFLAGLLEGPFSLLYYRALQISDVSIVVTLLQAIPIFSVLMGVFIFQEQLTLLMLLGIILIIGAGILATITDNSTKFAGFLSKAFVLMIAASFIVSISYALADYSLRFTNANTVFILARVGQVVFALGMMCARQIRKNFMRVISTLPIRIPIIILGLVILNLVGVYLQTLAYAIGPLSTVSVFLSVQPIFVLVIILSVNRMYPNRIPDKGTNKHILVRSFAVIMAVVGLAILSIS